MANRTLNEKELEKARKLLALIRDRLMEMSRSDPELLFAYRRKITKELSYDERSGPTQRKRLKAKKFQEQKGLCPICNKTLAEKYNHLDRFEASKGYTIENTRLVHEQCHISFQKEKGYK